MKNLYKSQCVNIKGLVLFLFCNFSFSQNLDWKSIIDISSQKLKNAVDLTYSAEYKIKYFDSSDTTKLPNLDFFLLKKPSDSILSFFVKIIMPDINQEKIFNGNSFYSISHNTQSIEEYHIMSFGKSFVKNNIFKQAIPSFLSSSNGFDFYINNHIKVLLSEVIDKDIKAWKIEFFLPTNQELTFLKRIIYIDKYSLLPFKFEGVAKFMDLQEEYFSLNLKNLNLNNNLEDNFFKLYDFQNYTFKKIIKDPINAKVFNESESMNFIEFKGVNLKNVNFFIDKEFYGNKLVLIDIWHLSCAPCIKAIPMLNNINHKYANMGLIVLGVNPIDSLIDKKKVISQFLNNLNVEYLNLFVSKDFLQNYHINTFPTYLLFKNGKLVYKKNGYNDAEIIDLENAILQHLK